MQVPPAAACAAPAPCQDSSSRLPGDHAGAPQRHGGARPAASKGIERSVSGDVQLALHQLIWEAARQRLGLSAADAAAAHRRIWHQVRLIPGPALPSAALHAHAASWARKASPAAGWVCPAGVVCVAPGKRARLRVASQAVQADLGRGAVVEQAPVLHTLRLPACTACTCSLQAPAGACSAAELAPARRRPSGQDVQEAGCTCASGLHAGAPRVEDTASTPGWPGRRGGHSAAHRWTGGP